MALQKLLENFELQKSHFALQTEDGVEESFSRTYEEFSIIFVYKQDRFELRHIGNPKA